jgi:hypothetical protein
MPTPEETKAMADILKKLENAENRVQQEPTVKEDGTVFNPKVSNDAQEMYNILNKLQNATENTAKTLIKEDTQVETPLTESFGFGGLNVVLNKTTVYGYKKTFYNITENGNTLYADIALFESAMAIIKNMLNKNDQNRTARILELDSSYGNYLSEAASYKQRTKNITEGVKKDVYMAKHGVASDKMKSIKKKIKSFL